MLFLILGYLKIYVYMYRYWVGMYVYVLVFYFFDYIMNFLKIVKLICICKKMNVKNWIENDKLDENWFINLYLLYEWKINYL